MNVKKIVCFQLADIQDAITILAKKQGVVVRNLTAEEFKTLIEEGSVEIEADEIRKLPVPIPEEQKEFPFLLFKDMSNRPTSLAVFINNIDEDTLYKYALPIIAKHPEKDVLLNHYAFLKISPTGEMLSYKQMYGDRWRQEQVHVGSIISTIGKELLNVLRKELRSGSGEITGIKGFKKSDIIHNVKSLGLSEHVLPSWGYRKKPLVMEEYFGEENLKDLPRQRNMGKGGIKEIEDFILLYGLQ